MQIQSKIERRFWSNALLGLVPDVLIGVVVASVTSSGPLGFLFTVLGLQILYFAIWLKNTIWTWVTFSISGRKWLTNHLYNYLFENRYPEPDPYISSVDAYLASISDSASYPCDLRIKAAIERANLVMPSQLGLIQYGMRMNMAYEDAIEKYKGAFR